MRTPRALLLVLGSTLAACGGILGFGDDPDEPPAPTIDPDSSVAPEGGPDPSGDAANDVADDVVGVVSGDGGLDAPDKTPIDAGPETLVVAHFEGAGVEGLDGADVAENMLQTKIDAIDGMSAHTTVDRPASLGWTFPPQPKVVVVFSLRILTMPAGPGAELARITGSSSTVSILIGKTGTFVLRTGSADLLGDKMSLNTTYRVGVEISAATMNAQGGFATPGGKITNPVSGPWTPGTIDALQIRTNDSQFAYVIDDVIVSTTPLK